MPTGKPVDYEEFAKQYMEAHTNGLSTQEFAETLGITFQAVKSRVQHLRERGVSLPFLRQANTISKQSLERIRQIVEAPAPATPTVKKPQMKEPPV